MYSFKEYLHENYLDALLEQTKIPVEVIRETKKAVLVKDEDGNEFWIQKRWLGSDGTVTKRVRDNAIQRQKEFDKKRKEIKKDMKSFVDLGQPKKETVKAVLYPVTFDITAVEKYMHQDIWLPKSVGQYNEATKSWAFPKWLLFKKIDEAKSKLPQNIRFGGGVVVDSIGTSNEFVGY